MCGAAGALVSSAHVATGAPVAPHCEGVTLEAALRIGGRMNQARELHQQYVDFYDQNPGETLAADARVAGGFGDREWHAGWVATYDEALGMFAVLTRGCF